MKNITKDELNKAIELHKEWLKDNSKGKRLVLVGYNLSNYDLSYSDLRHSDLRHSALSKSDLSKSDLRHSDLRQTYLSESDLTGANIDFSCWPLWCGSLEVKLDKKQKKQLGYHFADTLDDNDPEEKAIKEVIKNFVNGFHRVKSGECKEIK